MLGSTIRRVVLAAAVLAAGAGWTVHSSPAGDGTSEKCGAAVKACEPLLPAGTRLPDAPTAPPAPSLPS